MIYQARSVGNSKGIGYPEELVIYYSLQTGTNAKFTQIDTISSKATDQKVYFAFSKIIECRQIMIEWKKIHNTNDYPNKASACDIIFLYPEYGNIDNTLLNAFDSTDYTQLTLSQSYKNKNQTKMLQDSKKYQYNDYMKEYITRIVNILNGKLKYDPKREFTTTQKTETNLIEKRGELEKYSKEVLKMYFGATNRQSMGIYARANEKITVFVKSSVDTDPLPKIQFTQYIGRSYGSPWLGEVNELKLGKQTLVCDDFKVDNLKIPTFFGGPLYLINPYNNTEQNTVYIYVEGGTLFPTYKIGGNKEKYLEELKECINLNKKNNKTYFDITELSSNKAMITVRASDAYKIYSNKNNISPDNNLKGLDDYLEKLYIFDGIQFDKKQPYYNIKNNYLKINFRYSQPSSESGLAYAHYEHVGLFKDNWFERVLNFNIKTVSWGLTHEIGHMMDIRERVVSETSNNMLSKYYDAYLCGNNTWGVKDHQVNKIKYLTDDDTDDKLRGCKDIDNPSSCKGFLTNRELNYLIWWDLESFHHGYWSKLDNMYRFNNTLPKV